jgi:hypothetical protein
VKAKERKYYDPDLKEDAAGTRAEKWNWNEEAKVKSCCASDAVFLADSKAKKCDCSERNQDMGA